MAKKPKKSNVIKVDFRGVETSSSIPEGDYEIEIEEVEVKTSDRSGEDYLAFTFVITDGQYAGKKLYHNCSLQHQALFNLLNLFDAIGMDREDVVEFEPESLLEMTCGCSTTVEMYEGRKKSRIAEFYSLDDEPKEKPAKPEKSSKKSKKVQDDEDDEPEEKPTKKSKKSKKPEFEVGMKVTFTDEDGDDQTGKITDIDGDDVTVKVGKEEWELSMDELTPA